MPVIDSRLDEEALTLSFVTEHAAPAARVWQLWADPRQLERWWGPPGWPATFERHELAPGGRSVYYMTGPDGTRGYGWWQTVAVDEPERLEFDDGFADEQGEPTGEYGVAHAVVLIEPFGELTRMSITTRFATLEQLRSMVQMGMQEGMGLALGQIDAILAG